MNVLHLLYQSFPSLSGYSVRSHNILKFQNKYINAIALTDLNNYYKSQLDYIDHVNYYRYPKDWLYKILSKRNHFILRKGRSLYYKFNTEILKKQKPLLKKLVSLKEIDIIHTHSDIPFGKIGLSIAREFNIAFIFEIRGFMEETLVATGKIKKNSSSYFKYQKKRNKLAKASDLIITLGKNMKKRLIELGLNHNKIKVVPNGIDTEKFHPLPENKELKNQLSLSRSFVIGYIGNIRPFEGIELMIQACDILKKKNIEIKIVLIGNAIPQYMNTLIRIAKEKGIENNIEYLGPVPYRKISRYYSIIDIIVIPRLELDVSKLVTPLKPLEGMAMEKVVITSELPALCELVKPGISGDLFKVGDPYSLAKKIQYYKENKEELRKLGKKARNYVKDHFDWDLIINRYRKIYSKLNDN